MLLWLKFNIYSLGLAVLAMFVLFSLWWTQSICNIYIAVPAFLFASYIFFKALDIFSKFDDKKKISERLVKKATKHYDQRYFLPYMGSPCMRSVVYFSLRELKREDDYQSIKRRARAESKIFDPPRVVTISYRENGKSVFLAHDRVTGELEEI